MSASLRTTPKLRALVKKIVGGSGYAAAMARHSEAGRVSPARWGGRGPGRGALRLDRVVFVIWPCASAER